MAVQKKYRWPCDDEFVLLHEERDGEYEYNYSNK
eukprot:UN01197